MGTLLQPVYRRLPRFHSLFIAIAVVLIAALLGAIALRSVRAVEPSNEHFMATWERTDRPVLDGVVRRSWNWGPEGLTNELQELYVDSPNGNRQVQYFDKSRMEINDPSADPSELWYVTNGLLVVELMTGQMQVGDDTYSERSPATVPVAGDVNDPTGISYAMFADFRDVPPVEDGTIYTRQLQPDGTVRNVANLSGYNVLTAILDEVTNHRVAAPFWDFMTASGPVYVNGQFVEDLLFPNPFYSTGRPITEFYWVRSTVNGEDRDVGIQCFERRCLTYTPGNAEGFVVEAGNVGLHYYIWRYETEEPTATATATSPATETPTATATASPTASPTASSTPVSFEVEVNAYVDCDDNGTIDDPANAVGESATCDPFLGSEVETVVDGNPSAQNEVQRLGPNNATGGNISIAFDHPLVLDPILATGIPYDATVAELQGELDQAFLVAGVPLDAPTVSVVSQNTNARLNQAAMLFTYENGELAGQNVAQMVVDNSLLQNASTAGTFSTTTQGTPGDSEVQQLLPNRATEGSFTLSFDHPTAGMLTTGPIPYNGSANFVAVEIFTAFNAEGVAGDVPDISGGPANSAPIVFEFVNGDLSDIDLPQIVVDNSNLGALVALSQVQVFDADEEAVVTWQVDTSGEATGLLSSGQYDFCFSYGESTGSSDETCTGLVSVGPSSSQFNVTVTLDYE